MPRFGDWIDSDDAATTAVYPIDSLWLNTLTYDSNPTLDDGTMDVPGLWADLETIYTASYSDRLHDYTGGDLIQTNKYTPIVDDTSGYRKLTAGQVLVPIDITWRSDLSNFPNPDIPSGVWPPGAVGFEYEATDPVLSSTVVIDVLAVPDTRWFEHEDEGLNDSSESSVTTDLESYGYAFNLVDPGDVSFVEDLPADPPTGGDNITVASRAYSIGWTPGASLGTDVNEPPIGGVYDPLIYPRFEYHADIADFTDDMLFFLCFATGSRDFAGPDPVIGWSSGITSGVGAHIAIISYTPPRHRFIYTATPPLHQNQRVGGMETHALAATQRTTRQSSLLQRGML